MTLGENPGSVSVADIEMALRAALTPESLTVRDDSHLHAGHAGAQQGRHFSVHVTSARLQGLSRVARHRLVYDAVSSLMPKGIHALAIDAGTPSDSPTG